MVRLFPILIVLSLFSSLPCDDCGVSTPLYIRSRQSRALCVGLDRNATEGSSHSVDVARARN